MHIREQALEAFRVLGGRGWGRVDFLMDDAGNAYFLEVNTSPGMTDHSLVPMAARVAGIDYDALVLEVLARATLG
jgi:D-alanine-D-alanine ligase